MPQGSDEGDRCSIDLAMDLAEQSRPFADFTFEGDHETWMRMALEVHAASSQIPNARMILSTRAKL
jgi:hypothetical protein